MALHVIHDEGGKIISAWRPQPTGKTATPILREGHSHLEIAEEPEEVASLTLLAIGSTRVVDVAAGRLVPR